jgi:hypothetical protein
MMVLRSVIGIKIGFARASMATQRLAVQRDVSNQAQYHSGEEATK